ncbi:MAG TPA: cupin domain-containing protein [Anaerolineales bacterium]|nr:cupin domain-containing protein [Anaerolineales bacterium]HLO32972.1 cupin domain-containing protein [Anaerolineales bacterium]
MAIDLYQPFTNPVTKETFRCLACTEEAYVMEWIVQPDGYVPFEHIHVSQAEIFHVEQGQIRVLINRRQQIGQSGQTVTVPCGVRHIAYNNTSEPLICTVEYRPGLDIAKSFQCFSGLTYDRDVKGRYGINIPKMMYFMKRMNAKALARPANVPGPVYSLLMSTFYIAGTLMGWEKLYKKYTE